MKLILKARIGFLKGYLERGVRDGTGPHRDSAQRSISDKGMRQEAGEECPIKKKKKNKKKVVL